MANDIKSAELCLNAVQALEDQLRGARKTLINSETCVVNRGIMTAQLEYLRDNLPQTVEMAAKIVAEEESIRNETEQKRKEILETANMQAQNTLGESSQKAQAMMEQATAEANAMLDRASQEAKGCVDAAKAEAQRILQEAEKKATELVEEENIVRRARVESEELRESAKEDAANLHRNTLDYIDSLLAETDRKMSELINNIRLERNEIRNRR
jgi:cell division septum initiation protein DivIVA